MKIASQKCKISFQYFVVEWFRYFSTDFLIWSTEASKLCPRASSCLQIDMSTKEGDKEGSISLSQSLSTVPGMIKVLSREPGLNFIGFTVI